MENINILVIDDEEIQLSNIADYLENYPIKTFSCPKKALAELQRCKYDILIVDYKMPEMTGIELLLEAKRLNAYQYGILFTAYADKDMLEKALNKELVSKVIDKPLRLKEFMETVDYAIAECIRNREQSDQKIIGLNNGLKQVYQQVKSVAELPVNVLLTGETGTGKELIANLIHSMSSRQKNCFIPVNCAAIPADLLEAELFGYERGAFTGAAHLRIGKIELAHTGTLFLDEIGDLKLELQVKILRVIQEKRVERLGSVKSKDIDFRLITATNRDLEKAITEKLFREDLYYRINTFPIHLPALRDRKEDIEQLVQFYVHKYSTEFNLKQPALHETLFPFLKTYNWPGNIRELINAIQRVLIIAASTRKEILTVDDFVFLFCKPQQESGYGAFIAGLRDLAIKKEIDVNEIKGDILRSILKYFDDNSSQAERETGIPRGRFERNKE